jgi:acyl-CoA thioesterase II
VDARFLVHSLHGYFIRPGTSDEPIRFEVDRIRNGRSFLTRLVVARQSNGAILNLACSFQVRHGCAPPSAGRSLWDENGGGRPPTPVLSVLSSP